MMGLGSLGNGGSSSSSSNLSALAPPFTVDRSNPKPSSNPHMHFTEPPYPVSFNSSLHNWQYSHSSASRPDFFSSPVTEGDYIQSNCLPSLNDYLYSGSQSIPSSSTHWPSLNSGVKNATNDFAFLQYSCDVATSLVDSKPYYSPYVTPVVDDDDIPLVALSESSNDLLSSSHIAPLDGSSQVDYTRSLSGLEYTPQWVGIWSGLVDEERSKQTEPNTSFCSKEMNVADPYVYKNYMKQGVCVAESLSKCDKDSAISKRKSTDVVQRENRSVSLSTGQLNDKSFLMQNPSLIPVESSRTSMLSSASIHSESHLPGPSLESTKNSWNLQKPYNPSYEKCFQPPDYCINDVLGSENQGVSSSTWQLNDKSFLAQNLSLIPAESSRTSMLGSTSILSKSHLQGPSLESTTNSVNHQKHYNPSYEKCFQPFDYCMNDCISFTKSSPPPVIQSPVIGTTSSALNTVPHESVNFIGNIAAVNGEEFNGHNPSKIKVPYLPVSSEFKERYLDTSQSSFHLERNEPIFVVSSSNIKEELPNRPVANDALDHTFKPRCGFQVPDINVPDGVTLAVDGAKVVSSVENSTESLDHYNPAVDSPCWKGAPTSHFSPFEVSKVVTPQRLMKAFEASNSLNVHGTRILPPYTDDTVKVSQKSRENSLHHENGCVGNGLSFSHNRSLGANCVDKEPKSPKVGWDCPNLSSSNGVQFSTDVEYDLPNDSKCDSNFKPSHTNQLNLEGGDCTSKLKLNIQAAVEDVEVNANDASEDSCLPFPSKAMENMSCLPAEEVSNEPAKLHVGISRPKMNVQMLVNAVHNLSELLLFHCSKDASALNAHHLEALGQTINSLDACISNKIACMTPAPESVSLKQGISHNYVQEGSSTGRPKVTREAATNSDGQLDYQCMHEEKRNYNKHCNKADKFPDLVSLRDDADTDRDDDMVQAVKKVLNENFHVEEEIQSQTLLYKNLWLEAEAELCSLSYKARFNRLKIEMEKCKSQKAKDVSEDYRPVEKLPRSDLSPNPNISYRLISEAKDSLISETSTQYSSISSTTGRVNDVEASDVEASVMARFQILKVQGDNSNSVNAKAQQLPEVVDAASAGSRNCWPFVGDQSEGEILDTELEPHYGGAHFDCLRVQMDKCKSHNAKAHRLTPEAKDCPIPDTFTQDSPISSTTSRDNDVDTSVLTRFQILKLLGDKSNSVNTEGQQLPEVVDAASAGKRNCWPFVGDQSEGGILDVETEPHLEHHSGRAHIDHLKVQLDKCKSHNAQEKLPSSNVLPDTFIAHRFMPVAKDSPIPETITQDSPFLSTASRVNDVEASVMARFHILKCRGDSSNSVDTEGKQLPDAAAFAGMRNCSPFVGYQLEGGILDVGVGPHLDHKTSNHSEDKCGSYVDGSDYETVKEFRVCVTDELVTQSCGDNRQGNQLLSAWYDNSSSDWEHVMKDEFLLQN